MGARPGRGSLATYCVIESGVDCISRQLAFCLFSGGAEMRCVELELRTGAALEPVRFARFCPICKVASLLMTGTNYTFIDFVKYLTRKYCSRCVSRSQQDKCRCVDPAITFGGLCRTEGTPSVQTHCHPLTSLYLPVKFLGSEQR